jgi:hypothetical protein
MTKEDIIRMAQEAGFDEWWDNGCSSWDTLQETFERFAALVAAAERKNIIAKNAPEIARVNAHIKALEDELEAQPRQWQGLTDEEREQVINANFATGLWQMAKDLEAKLKEKNT